MNNRFGKLPTTYFRPPARLSRGGAFQPSKEPEHPLTGQVQGIKAAEGEERLSRVLNKSVIRGVIQDYKFRWVTLKRNTINFRELDFLVTKTTGEAMAISVKNKAFTHFGTKIIERDKMSEIIILAKLKELGIHVREVTTVWDVDLKDEETAQNTARKLRLYR